jgi:hypothetical protein
MQPAGAPTITPCVTNASTRSATRDAGTTAAGRGCHVLISNSTAPEIAALYETNADARAAGLQTHRVAARRAINSNVSRRGVVDEYLITNISG